MYFYFEFCIIIIANLVSFDIQITSQINIFDYKYFFFLFVFLLHYANNSVIIYFIFIFKEKLLIYYRFCLDINIVKTMGI